MFVYDINKVQIIPVADAAKGKALADEVGGYFVAAQEDLSDMTNYQLVQLFNSALKYQPKDAPVREPVKKFADKTSALRRTWEVVRAIELRQPAPTKEPIEPRKASRQKGGCFLAPKERAVACREGTKQAAFIDTMWNGGTGRGATFRELLEATSGGKRPWREVTVRAAFSWDVNHVKGYGVRTVFMNGEELWRNGHAADAVECGWPLAHVDPEKVTEEDIAAARMAPGYDPELTVPTYHLVMPKGLKAPLPHDPRKGQDRRVAEPRIPLPAAACAAK